MSVKEEAKQIELSCPHIDRVHELLEQLAEMVDGGGNQIILTISDELENTRAINRELRAKIWEYAQLIELQEIDKTELTRQVSLLQSLVRDARSSLDNVITFMGEYANVG